MNYREFSSIDNIPMPMLFYFCKYSTNIPDKKNKKIQIENIIIGI